MPIAPFPLALVAVKFAMLAVLGVCSVMCFYLGVRDGFVRRRVSRVSGEFHGWAAIAVGAFIVIGGCVGVWSIYEILTRH